VIPFIIVAAIMVAVALAWVLVPLVRHRRSDIVAREASNVAILRDQLKELDNDVASGALAPAQHEQAKHELEQRVLEEAAPLPGTATPTTARAGKRTVWVIAGIIPLAAIALYALWGNLDAFSPIAELGTAQHEINPQQMNEMVAKLAAKLEKEPGNAEGWMILARSYYAMQRFPDAVRAFERVNKLVPNEPNVLVDYADALAASQQSLQGRPTELVMQALQIDPANWKGLALAGSAAFDRNDYKQAVAYWEQLKQVLPSDSPMAKSVDSSIAEARQLGGIASRGAPSELAKSVSPTISASAEMPSGTAPASPATAKVEGTVTLAPQVAAKASPDDTVFIFARPAEGPRMPLAIIKRQVKDLPTKFTLDDSMAMTPNATLASYPQIVVGARVSKSGNAMPKPGDLEGYSLPVKAGATGLNVVIDRTLP